MESYFGIMIQFEANFDLKIIVRHSISQSSDFVFYLENYLMDKHHTSG